ncbi:lonely Cys domain-containing protein [Streptomyces sp. NPDC048291]|uniref:lonely Cys domain-containing protein n=1 Tax=Streptomyces sp. NPDC048291 TaxID=3365530 RepID=UPI00371E570D
MSESIFQDKNWDPNPVYELGNALIDFGDYLDEQVARMTSAEFDLNNGAWQGDAEMWMTQAYSDQRESVMEIIEEFWDTGEMINYYAMLRTEQEATLAKQSLANLIAGIVGVLLGALLFVAPELLGLIGVGMSILADIGGMLGSIFTFLVNVGKSVGQFVGSAATAVGEALPDWVVTMAGVTGNVARFGIEFMGVNAASVAAGNAAAGLETTAEQLIPVPTSLEQIPGFISDMVLWGGIGVAVASAAKGLVNVAREKLDIIKSDMNVGDVNVGVGDVGTSAGSASTGAGSGTSPTLPSSVTAVSSVSGTIADSSKGLTKSDLTLSSDVEVNSAVTQTLTGTTVRTSTDTAPAPTPTKVTATVAPDGPSAGGGTAVPDKVTPVDAGASPGGSSAVRTATDGATQPVQPAPKTDTVGGNTGGNTAGNTVGSTGGSSITSGVADGSTSQSVLHDVGSGLSGVAKTAQAVQRTVDATTVGHSTGGGPESAGAAGAEHVVRTNLEAQPATGTPHQATAQTPSPTSAADTGARAQDTGGSAAPGVAKAVDAGVKQTQSALRTVGDNHAVTSDAAVRNATPEETVSPVRSVASGKPEVVHPAGPVREASAGQIEGGARTGTSEVAGSTAPRAVAGEQGARGTADGGAAAKAVGARANLGDTAVRPEADQVQRASAAAEGTRTAPNAGRAPLKSAAGLGGRQVRPAADRAATGSTADDGGHTAALARPAEDRTAPVEAPEGISPADGTVHGASARAVSEARSATTSEAAGPERPASDRTSGDTDVTATRAERQRVAEFRETAQRQKAADSRTTTVREEATERSAGASRDDAVSGSADDMSRSAAARSAEATEATDASGAGEKSPGQLRDQSPADRATNHEPAVAGTEARTEARTAVAKSEHEDGAGTGTEEQPGHEQPAYAYRHDMSDAKNAAYEEAKGRQNETYESRLADEAERAGRRLEHNRRLWNAFEDVRDDLAHEYPAVRSEPVGDIEAVVRGEGVPDRYAEGMSDAYHKAVDEHRQYLEEHPEKRADELRVGTDAETGAVTHSPLQAKLAKALESVLDDGYRGPSPAELVEAIRRSSDENFGPKDWARKIGVPEDLVSTVAGAFQEARFEHSRAGGTDLHTHAFEETLAARLEDHLGNLEHHLPTRSLADRMIREENRFQGGQPRPWREEVKQRLETRIEGIGDAVERGDLTARQGEAAIQSLYEGLPQEFALEAALRQLRSAAADAFDRALTHPDRPGENLFTSEALFDRRPFSPKDEAAFRTDFLNEFTTDLHGITRQLDLDGNLVHRDFLPDLFQGAQARFDALTRGLETRLTLAEDATRTFDSMADARSLDRSSDDMGTVRKDFLDEYAEATGTLADGRPLRELTRDEYADAAPRFNRAVQELHDRWAARLDAKAAERDLREQAAEVRDNRYVASREVADKMLADHTKAFDEEVTGILDSREPADLSADDWAAYTADLSEAHLRLTEQLAARHDLHSGLEKTLAQADDYLYAVVGSRKEAELGSQAKRVQDDMHRTLTDAYREQVGMPERGQWSGEELSAREAEFHDTVLDPYVRSLSDRLAYEGAFDTALAEGGRRFNDLSSKVDEATGAVTGRYALNGYDLGRVADDFRNDAARTHQEIFGPADRDVEAALGTERADGDVFGTARSQAWRDLVNEVEGPRQRAEQDAWRAQLRQMFSSFEADAGVRGQVETHASALGSDSVRQTFREDSRQVLDSFRQELTAARTTDDLSTAVRTAQEKIQSLYDEAAQADAEFRRPRETPSWKLDFTRLTIDRTPLGESGRQHGQAGATASRDTGAPDERAQAVSMAAQGPVGALAGLRAGVELREQPYQQFEQRLADNPALRDTIPYAEQAQVREWYADRWTQGAQEPDAVGHDEPNTALDTELTQKLAQAYSQAKATAQAHEVFDREIALSWKLRSTYASFGASSVARSIRDDFGRAMTDAAATAAGEEGVAARLTEEFRQRYTQAYEGWRAEQRAHESFEKALVLPEGVDLTRGRPSWAQEQRAWYDGGLRELRGLYTKEWLAAGEGRPGADTASRLETGVRRAASILLARAESLGGPVRQAAELARARGAESGWSRELTRRHSTEQGALVQDFVAYLGQLRPGDRAPAMADLAAGLDALRDAARVRHLADQDLAGALSAVRLAPVTVTSDAVAGWARREIDRIRAEHVRAFEAEYAENDEVAAVPVPAEPEHGQGRKRFADGLSAADLSLVKAGVNKELARQNWRRGPVTNEDVARVFAALPSYWKTDLKSIVEVTAGAVVKMALAGTDDIRDIKLGRGPGGAPNLDAVIPRSRTRAGRQAQPQEPGQGQDPGGIPQIVAAPPADEPAPLTQQPRVPGARIDEELALHRPARLDHDLLPPPVHQGPRRFEDGSRMPDHLNLLTFMAGGEPDVLVDPDRRAVLDDSVAYGQSEVTLRGTGQVVAEMERLLGQDPTTRPQEPRPSGRRQRPGGADDLLGRVRQALGSAPRTFAGEGRDFVYRTAEGRIRTLRVRTRNYGEWERFDDGSGKQNKVDNLNRSQATTGAGKTVATTRQLAPGVPLGPPSGVFAGFGRVSARFGYSRAFDYLMSEQVVSQSENRSGGGSHQHLDDVHYELTVIDGPPRAARKGVLGTAWRRRPAEEHRADQVFGFGVRDGLGVRLPDSLTDQSEPGRTPREMDLGAESDYRLVYTEDFGPLREIRDWAADRIGAEPASSAYQELDGLFSSDSFQQLAGRLTHSRVTSVPLQADDRKRTPLGAFVIERLVPGRARFVTETDLQELRETGQLTVRNERKETKSLNQDFAVVTGPTFNLPSLFGLTDAVKLRLQLGPSGRYGHSSGRAQVTGGSGAVKAVGQVKDSTTALYVVEKFVYVRKTGDAQPTRFVTWSLDRMTQTEARRLAGWDDGTTLPARHGGEPYAPAYLTPDHPPTLGMSRVEQFTFADGRYSGTPAPAAPAVEGADGIELTDTDTGPARTVLDTLIDQVLEVVAQKYPGMVAPPAELGDPSAWRNAAHYQMVLSNTLTVINALSHHSMAGNLEALTTTGIRVGLVDPGRATRGYRYIWLDAELTDRRYEGTQNDLKMRFSAPGATSVAGQQSMAQSAGGGFEFLASVRDKAVDNVNAPLHAGTAQLGYQAESKTQHAIGYGPSATFEPMAISTKPSHLYSYGLTLTASTGGYWRFRSLFRGIASLGILGTQPFVFSQGKTEILGDTAADPATRGRVLLSVPSEHMPARDPHTAGAVNPYAGTDADRVTREPMTDAQAKALAAGSLAAVDTGRQAGPLGEHAHHTVSVLGLGGEPGIVDRVLKKASGGLWHLTEAGAPAHDAAVRPERAQFLTADFDQSSGPLGSRTTGLFGKGPYLDYLGTVVHRVRVSALRALGRPVPLKVELTVGGSTQASGSQTKSFTHSFGGTLVYNHSHTAGPGITGGYGLVMRPWWSSRGKAVQVARTITSDINRVDGGHQVLVAGDAEHEVAASVRTAGLLAPLSRLLPGRTQGSAGERWQVRGGWLGHIPERSAHLLKVIKDAAGAVPTYTNSPWKQPEWFRNNLFATYPVNSLDTTRVLDDFDRRTRDLGLDDSSREAIRQLVSARVVRALRREMTGIGTSAPARIGGPGWKRIRIGTRTVRVRARLVPDLNGQQFRGLWAGLELEDHRLAVETVTEAFDATTGRDTGVLVTEGVHTSDPTVRSGGPTYAELGSNRQGVSGSRATTRTKLWSSYTNEPHAEFSTGYRLELSMEIEGDGAESGRGSRRKAKKKQQVFTEGDVGRLTELVPTSLMRPDTTATTAADAAPDALAPPEPTAGPPSVTVLTGAQVPTTPERIDAWRATRHPDGTTRPFTMPAEGFQVRTVVGADQVQAANVIALAKAYDNTLAGIRGPLTGEALDRALDRATANGLTAPGTGSAQALEDGTGKGALSAFFHDSAGSHGYQVAGLTEDLFADRSDGTLAMYSRPDLAGAELLAVADDVRMEAADRYTESGNVTASQGGTQDSSLGAFPALKTDMVGVTGPGASGTGTDTIETDGRLVTEERVKQDRIKPKAARAFAFAVPVTWLSVADVNRQFKDGSVATWLRDHLMGPFGGTRPGPQAVESRSHAVAWVREDVARDLGLITDANFPSQVAKAWDRVKDAGKEWADADGKYWKLRRSLADLQESVDAAVAARSVARRDRDALHAAARPEHIAVHDELVATITAAETRAAERRDGPPSEQLARARTTAENARATVEALDAERDALSAAEPEHDGWADLVHDQLRTLDERIDLARRARRGAEERLAAVEREELENRQAELDRTVREARQTAGARRAVVDRPVRAAEENIRTAARAVRTAQEALDIRVREVSEQQTAAETAAAAFHQVRAETDRLTRWHRLPDDPRTAADPNAARTRAGVPEPELAPAAATAEKPKAAPRPGYADAVTLDGSPALIAPEGGTVHRLVDVPEDGRSFFHALGESLGRESAGDADTLRREFADRLAALPDDSPLLAYVTPDTKDTFTDDELRAAGVDLGTDTPQRREFDALGVLPHSAGPQATPDQRHRPLTAAQRRAIAVAQLRRPAAADAADETGWDHSAADVLASLAAQRFGVVVRVVAADGTFQDYGPDPDVPAAADAERVVLHLTDRHFRAVDRTPTGGTAGKAAPPATAETTPTGPSGDLPAHATRPWTWEGLDGTAATDRSRFDAATRPGHLIAPDGRVSDLVEATGDGNRFYAAVATALTAVRNQPAAAVAAVTVPGAAQAVPATARLASRATFRPGELTDAGLTLTPEQTGEFERSGGRLPASLTLTRPQEEALIRAQLTAARRWDRATALLAAELTAEANGIRLTLVHEDGTVHAFGAAATGADTTVTVYERGDEYLAAVPATPLDAPQTASTAHDGGAARAEGAAQVEDAAQGEGAGLVVGVGGGKGKQRATDEGENPAAATARRVDVPTAVADHEAAVAEAQNERVSAAAEVGRLNALLRRAEQTWQAGAGPSGTRDPRVAPQQRLDEAMARFEAAEHRLTELREGAGQILGGLAPSLPAVRDTEVSGSADDPTNALLARAWRDLAAARRELATAEGLFEELTAGPEGDSEGRSQAARDFDSPERVENGPASPYAESLPERPRALSMDITDLAPSREVAPPAGSQAAPAASHPALAQPLNPNPPLNGYLYHGSSAPPENVFREGLNSAARQEGGVPHYDITQHIHNARGSGFVSTTANQNVALQFIRPSGDTTRVGKNTYMKREGYIYVVDPGDAPLIHLHSQNLPENLARFRYQEEWAALDSVPPERIKGVIRVSGYYNPVPDGRGGITIEPATGSSLTMPFTPNPGFAEPTASTPLTHLDPDTGAADAPSLHHESGDLGLAHPERVTHTPAGRPDNALHHTPAGTRAAADPADGTEETASPEPWTRGKVTFEEGSKAIDPVQRGRLTTLARKVAEVGLRDVRAGLPAPWITVTGHGNGSWLTPTRDDRGAARTGQERADAVADALRTEIWNALYLLQQNDLPTTTHVDAGAFTVRAVSGGRTISSDGASEGAELRTLRRVADVEIEPAPRSAAVELLDGLRSAGPDPALREAPFNPDPFARRILHLGEQQQVRDHHRQELYALVDEAIAAGRATSVAALGAYHLWRHGALSAATRITGPDGRALGRNWTGAQITDLATKSYFLVREGRFVDSPAALWQQPGTGDTRPYVVAAKGGHDHVVVPLANGSEPRVPLDEFAELLAMDTDLAGLDAGLPVVLAVPHAGARSPRLPRTAAARTGRTVWAYSGQTELYDDPKSQRTRIVVADRRAAGEPLGSWFASGPDLLPLDASAAGAEDRFLRTIDGTLVPDDDIMTHTLAADGRAYGRAVLGKDDIVRREAYFDSLPAMNEYVHIDPVSGQLQGAAQSVPWSGREAYFFNLHGHPGEFEISRADGTLKTARGDQVGGYLRRSPSFRRLPADGVVVLMSCWVGAAANGHAFVNTAGRAPFVADPLTTLSEAQQVANHTDRTVFAVDRVHYLTYEQGTKRQGIATTAEGGRRQWLELRPEPTGAALDDLARTASLHTADGPAPDEARESTLRLVRALRQVFGAAVEDDKDDAHGEYQRLVRGIGALESMRRNDARLRDAGPFTMDLLERAARAHLGRSAGSALDSTHILAVLEAAGTHPAGTALRDFVRLPSVDKALGLLAQGDADRRAAEVLDLEPADTVTAAHRQRLLWATVKAVEGLDGAADVDALAAKVLHLGATARPVDDALREELLRTLAGAAAAGRDVHNPTAVATHHLRRNGALSKDTLLRAGNGRVIGRNWTGRPMTDPVLRDRYIAVDPAVGKAGAAVRPVPWRASVTAAGTKASGFLVLAEGGRAHVDMPWPDGSRRPVPADEIAELLASDDELSSRPQTEPIVPVLLRTGRSRPLMRALSDRAATGRTAYMPAAHVDLFHDTAAKEYYLVVDEPAQGTSATTGWARTEPPALTSPGTASATVTVTNSMPAQEAADAAETIDAADAADATDATEVLTAAPAPPTPRVASASAGTAAAATVGATTAPASWTTAKVTFEEGSKDIDPVQRAGLAALARKIAEAGLRDIREGFLEPLITITGHGNGSWLKLASTDRGAEQTGRQRADAVADALRTEIGNALTLLQQNDPPTAVRVDVDGFGIDRFSEGRKTATGGPADGSDLRALRRQVEIEIDLADRSPAVELLNKLRLADPEAGLHEGAFDRDALARRILHIGAYGPVRDTHRSALYSLVEDAMAAGRATSLDALGAFDLWRRGALSAATGITAPDGRALGRNWSDSQVDDLITATYDQVSDKGEQTPAAAWDQQGPGDHRPYVIAAQGNHDHVDIRLPDRSLPRVPLGEFAELLAMDQELAGLDGHLPVVLVVPHAGARSPRLPRVAAARSGRTVWAHSGNVSLYNDAVKQETRIRVTDRRLRGEPLGTWFASEPDYPGLTALTPGASSRSVRLLDGTLLPDDEIMSYTLAADGRPYGRAIFNKVDQSHREPYFDLVPTLDEYVHLDPVTENVYGDAERVPWAGRTAYFFQLHGSPGSFGIVTTGRTNVSARGDQVGEYLQRRPSLQRLAADGVVVLMSCWVGAPADSKPHVTDASPAPFVADPLATVSEAQQVANHTDRTVFAVDRIFYFTREKNVRRQGVAATAEGQRRKWLELRPEPAGEVLDDLARAAGLHTAQGPAPEELRVATLRLVRALRQTFGAAVEDGAHGEYTRLVRGIGALESMRRNDARLRDEGPFTMDLLARAARSHLGRAAGSALDAKDILTVLEAAALRPAGTVLRDFVPLASVDRALGLLAQGDADRRAVEVLDLEPAGTVTAVHRQRLLWATVKAVESLDGAADVDALAAKVLHLPASAATVDGARRAELVWAMASAAAAGRDLGNPSAVAAHHLERNGALDPATLLKTAKGVVLGRNWTGTALRDPLVADAYLVSSNGTSAANAKLYYAPWRVDGALAGQRPPAYFVLGTGGSGHLDMPWPDGTRRQVPADEIAELLANDPVLSGRPTKEAIVPVVPGSGRGEILAKALASRSATARKVYTPAVELDLFHDTTTHDHVIVTAQLSPGALAGTEWELTEPPALATPAPVPVAPAPEALATAAGQGADDETVLSSSVADATVDASASAAEVVEGPMPNAVIPTDAADIIPPPIPYPGRQVFVALTDGPASVLAEGLVPAGTGLDLVAYAQEAGDSGHGFVTADTSPEAAARRLTDGTRGYVWEVDAPGGIDLTATLDAYGLSGTASGGQEILFAGGVASRFVKGGWAVVPGGEGNTLGERIPNPHYGTAPGRRLPLSVVVEKREFPVEDVVSADELRFLNESLDQRDTEAGEEHARALGARLIDHIEAELAKERTAPGHVDVYLTMKDGSSSLAGMALAQVVANGLGRRAVLTVGGLRTPVEICSSRK